MAGQSSDQLLALLGEELKQPLVAIAQIAELESNSEIKEQAKRALRTIDNVLLYKRISSGQIGLELEPVHVGSTMRDVELRLKPLHLQHGCRTELQISKGLQPVDVDKKLLFGVVESLWQAFLSTVNGSDNVVCQAKKTNRGIRISLNSSSSDLSDVHFAAVNAESSQPLAAFAGPSADFMTAQQLCSLFSAKITKSSKGIGVTLPISKQLQMV